MDVKYIMTVMSVIRIYLLIYIVHYTSNHKMYLETEITRYTIINMRTCKSIV